MADIFFRPEGALADVIPFYNPKNKKFYIYYLHDYRDVEKHGIGCDWDLLTTENLVDYEDHGTVLPRGNASERDLFVFTGDVIACPDGYYIFYTGFSPFSQEMGRPAQVILRAKSEDLIHWEKDTDFVLEAPSGQYAVNDWRDPFLYREGNKFCMLLASRKADPEEFSPGGVTVRCSSEDLLHWRVEEKPFWDPGLYYTHECPELFRMGEYWYMVYSEYSDAHFTRYIMSRDKENWIVPENDHFDGSLFYAAKSAGDDKKRYLFGWIATLEGDCDTGEAQWGGSLAVHEIYPKADGMLAVCIPGMVLDAFSRSYQKREAIRLFGIGCRKWEWMFRTDGSFCMECDIVFLPSAGKFGVALSAANGRENYCFSFYQKKKMLAFEKFPNVDTRVKYMNCQVPVPVLAKGKIHIILIYEQGIAELCVDQEIVLSARMYPDKETGISFFVENCTAEAENIIWRARED